MEVAGELCARGMQMALTSCPVALAIRTVMVRFIPQRVFWAIVEIVISRGVVRSILITGREARNARACPATVGVSTLVALLENITADALQILARKSPQART